MQFSYEETFFFRKPTKDSLRQSLGAMTYHVKAQKVTQINMPNTGCEWHEVERLIKKICAQSNKISTLYYQNKDEQLQKQDEARVGSALGKAQRQDLSMLSSLNLSNELDVEKCPHRKNC